MLPFLEKMYVTKELVSAAVSCGQLFCHSFEIINAAANEIKSLRARKKQANVVMTPIEWRNILIFIRIIRTAIFDELTAETANLVSTALI